MAALTITASQVIPGANANFTQGIAAAALTAGQAVRINAAGTVALADADDATNQTNVLGIAVVGANIGGPVTVQTTGTLTLGAGAAPAAGTVYIVSATAGGIAPNVDGASTWMTTILGVGGATNTIILNVFNSGQVKP